jgi:RNA polymerase sigma-70 factor (ECF subfamily)
MMIANIECPENGGEARTLTIQQQIIALQPNLRAFAMSICGNASKTDDLVQETLLRAITKIDTFQPGTNLGAWLTTILRNCFLSDLRKHRNEVEDAEGSYALALRVAPEQESSLEFKEFRVALSEIPFDQREALLLVCAAGLSYEETAAICRTNIGTIKSRINRARSRLAAVLSIENVAEIGFDNQTRGILVANQGLGPAQWQY